MNKSTIILGALAVLFVIPLLTDSAEPAYDQTPGPTVSKASVASWRPERLDEPSCHPSYSGCLDPDASDYDCRGGSGDGPRYTGRVRVIGYDEFGLDRDGNGWGCE